MKGKILFIDDNPLDLKVASAALARLGFECVTYQSSREALEWAEQEVPQIILLDLQMPEISGYKLIPKIRAIAKLASVPIIIVSGKNKSEDVRLAIKAGAIDYIIKPIDPLVLQEKVERAQSKSNSFVDIPVDPSNFPNAFVVQNVSIIGLSEFGVRLATPVKIQVGDSLELGGLNAEQMGISQVWVRALQIEFKSAQNTYIAQCCFVGISERERQIIRRTCRQMYVKSKEV